MKKLSNQGGAYYNGVLRVKISLTNRFSSNGKENTEWIVLAKEGDSVLLISRYCLDCQQYNSSFTSITWEKCTLRSWLNGTFLDDAFSAEEQKFIVASSISTPDNPSYGTDGGSDTTDKVFLLSIEEAQKYIWRFSGKTASSTEYAKAQGAYVGRDGKSLWWLRSPGENGRYANYIAYVQDNGVLNYNGTPPHISYGIRPAMWITLGD